MQKQQIKPKKDKKKNTQTGLLMGQNINVFSQLSATYLTSKSNATQQQEHFAKQTQIIQYHDQNVNRLISLLRKKAEVTKVKAVVQLKQAINQMNESDMEEFIPTFANLYQEIIVNEQSKQVYEEFIDIAASIVQKYKKVALRQIATLYPSMLISMKFGKLTKLLFTGTQKEINEKAYILFLKKQVKKKFILLSKLLLQSQQLHLVTQTNYQRNLYQYVKIYKQLLNIYLSHSKINDLRNQTVSIVTDVCQLLTGKSIDQYFKVGGRGKASLLEIYSYMVKFHSLQPQSQINWKKFAKIVCQHFLDKDPIVQTTLWKNCNKQLLISLKSLAKKEEKQDIYTIYNELLPKSQDKLIDCLSLGGLAMYRSLCSFIKQHQSFEFTLSDSHKSVIQKLSYQRKFISQILSQQDENEARIQCYFMICQYLIRECTKLDQQILEKIIQKEGEKVQDSKRAKQIRSLVDKLRTEIVSNLEKRYYTQPPVSKNYLSYYIPEYLAKLLNEHQFPSFTPTFHPKLTFALYKQLRTDSPLLQFIYGKSESSLQLLLAFYETWKHTGKQVNLDMSEENDNYEQTAKIFLLANKNKTDNKQLWFNPQWDLRKSAIVYDPRLTSQDLQTETDQPLGLNLTFSPINKHLTEIYKLPQLDSHRFAFFMQLLENPDIEVPNLKFFLPYLFEHLVNEDNIEVLMQKYLHKVSQLLQGKWIVGEREIAFLRISTQCFNIFLLKNQVNEKLINKFRTFFLSIGSFLKTLNTYKMDTVVIEILKQLNQLLRVKQYEQLLLQAVQSLLNSIFLTIYKQPSQEEKHRKNRLKRINQFIEHCVWYMVRKGSDNYSLLLVEVFREQKLWLMAEKQIEPWAVAFTVLNLCSEHTIDRTVGELLNDFTIHYKTISMILSCHLFLPLQACPEYKRQFILLRQSLTRQYYKLSTEQQLFYLQQLIIYQYEQERLTESQGLRQLVRNVVKNYHQFNEDNTTFLAKNIVQLLIQRLLEQKEDNQEKHQHELKRQKLSIRTIIVTTILTEIPLQDLSFAIESTYINVLELLQRQTKNLQSHFHKFLSICLVSTTLWRTQIGEETLAKWESLTLTKQLLAQLIPQITEIQPLTTYHSYVIFSTINSLYPILGYEMISANMEQIMRLIWANKDRQNELYIFEQEEKIRLINRMYLEINKNAAYEIMKKLPEQALAEYGHYEKFLLQLEEQQQQELQSQQLSNLPQQKSIANLFIEYSELLMKITTFISMGNTLSIPQQKTLICLMQCPFAGVKKTSFILLKQLYEYKLVAAAIPQIFQSHLMYKLKPEHELESIKTANEIYNFLYTWLTLMNRKKAIEVVQNDQHQEEELSLQDYVQSTGVSELLLSNLFLLIADKLDYLKYETDFSLSVEQLLEDDFTFNLDEEQHIEQKLFQLSAKVLFFYSINFPLYLRTFMDKSKKYKTVCEKLLRNYISDAIFAKQVNMIEVRQPEWKANNNLEIYVVKKNKQIYAEYQHDVIRIGLRLVMRPNYPLTPIHIEFGEGLKMEDGSKWALMLQSQLHNKNNSIINGIILWKQNIDKKLSGIEECAICYDIVDPKGHLPKKACKTCKKKFHSNCIMKWFSKSNKSECPLCKSQFL